MITKKLQKYTTASTLVMCFLLRSRLTSPRRKNNANDKTIERESFRKDENKNHTYEELWLLRVGPTTDINK